MEALKRNFEALLILQVLLSLFLVLFGFKIGHTVKTLTLLLLAFYYWYSSVKVLKDKRVERGLRVFYAFVLSGYAIGLCGSLFKISLWQGSSLMLLAGISASLVVIIMSFGIKKLAPTWNLNPLLFRAVPYSLVFAFFFQMSARNTFLAFSPNKEDLEWADAYVPYYENPKDSIAIANWEAFKASRNIK